MVDLPTNARVHCSDGPAGRSTYIVGNPVNRQITHLVVKSNRPPFKEYLVPIDQVEETTPDLIKLKCTRNDLDKMEPFEYEELVPTTVPHYRSLPSTHQTLGVILEQEVTYIPVKTDNIPPGELALRRGAQVEATDGHVGQVDELLINSNTMQVTHLVLLTRHIFERREITISVSQIAHVVEDTVYLKLDRQSVEKLPTTPTQRWSLNDLA
jgi:hypothetical protein